MFFLLLVLLLHVLLGCSHFFVVAFLSLPVNSSFNLTALVTHEAQETWRMAMLTIEHYKLDNPISILFQLAFFALILVESQRPVELKKKTT
jgi:hypothetical protein